MPLAWQYNILVLENLAANQADGIALVNRPSQGELFDRMIQSDSVKVFPAGNFADQMTQVDGLRFALAGGTAQEVLFLSDRNIMQDAFHNPNILLTQAVRELVMLPTSANIRLTQAPRELVMLPTSTNIRLTQMPRELVMVYPEAFLAEEDFQMSIGDQLFLQESVFGSNTGLFFLTIGERNAPGMFDQSGADNVKVKKNQQIKANNLVTGDTTLNHWLDALTATVIPGNTAQTLTDQLTLSDAFTDKLLITLTESLSDQFQGMTDAAPVKIMLMQLPFIQTINLWQEFFAQPYLGIFTENMQDQWQDSLAGFMPFFMPLADQMVLSDSMLLPMSAQYSDTLTLTDSIALAAELDELFLDALVFSDSLAFNNPQSYQDQLTMTDSFTIAEAIDELLSDDGSGNWADAIVELLGTSSFQDQLVLSDSFTLGYGNFLPDQLIMSDSEKLLFGIGLNVFEQIVLTDQLGQFPGLFIVEQLQQQDAVQFPVWLSLADQLAQADSVGAGYGDGLSDGNSLTDAMNLVESFETMLADATPTMLENLQQLFNYLLAIEDGQTMIEQMNLMYGLLISGDFLQFDDEINVVGIVLPFLTDDASQNWLDAILFEIVFAPSEIVVRDFKVLAQILASALDTAQQQQADSFKSQGEQQATFDVLLDGEV